MGPQSLMRPGVVTATENKQGARARSAGWDLGLGSAARFFVLLRPLRSAARPWRLWSPRPLDRASARDGQPAFSSSGRAEAA
jgi:hypothetical protein